MCLSPAGLVGQAAVKEPFITYAKLCKSPQGAAHPEAKGGKLESKFIASFLIFCVVLILTIFDPVGYAGTKTAIGHKVAAACIEPGHFSSNCCVLLSIRKWHWLSGIINIHTTAINILEACGKP